MPDLFPGEPGTRPLRVGLLPGELDLLPGEPGAPLLRDGLLPGELGAPSRTLVCFLASPLRFQQKLFNAVKIRLRLSMSGITI